MRKTTSIPSVVIGNLTMGGTGKTPMILFLAQRLKPNYTISILSRGYGRISKGFIQVTESSNSMLVGDEPLEIYNQVENMPVYVCENRFDGIEKIRSMNELTDLVLLDDGFQHLGIKSTCSILLCDFNNPFFDDFVVPSGRLREFKLNAKLADAIIVSKCPKNLLAYQRELFDNKLNRYSKNIFYAHYQISKPKFVMGLELNWEDNFKFVLVTGIANSALIQENFGKENTVKHFNYQDHYNYNKEDVLEWIKECEDKGVKAIITTRKDLMRLKNLIHHEELIKNSISLFEIHTEVEILDSKENELINIIKNNIK